MELSRRLRAYEEVIRDRDPSELVEPGRARAERMPAFKVGATTTERSSGFSTSFADMASTSTLSVAASG